MFLFIDCYTYCSYLYAILVRLHLQKWQSNEIFDLKFFSSFKPTWVKGQRIKIFSILIQISPRYLNFKAQGDWLAGLSHPEEIGSLGYQTPEGHVLEDFFYFLMSLHLYLYLYLYL